MNNHLYEKLRTIRRLLREPTKDSDAVMLEAIARLEELRKRYDSTEVYDAACAIAKETI